MKNTFLFNAVTILNAIFLAQGLTQGSKSLTNSTTTLNTVNDEIAHLTCTSRGHPVSSIKWEKEGKELGDQSPGVVVISCNNGTIMESHLLVAVTEDERRGTYTCVVLGKDGETRRAFVIQGQKKFKLKNRDLVAIGVGIGMSVSLSAVILFFLVRGIRRLNNEKARDNPRLAEHGQVNPVVEEDTAI